MTCEDLQCKPGVDEKSKYKYSSLGKFFNKRLDEKDKKGGLLKRLKNIEGKDEKQLKVIKDQGERQLEILTSKTDKKVDFKNISFKGKLDSESRKTIITLTNKIKRWIIQNLSALAQVSNITIILPSF